MVRTLIPVIPATGCPKQLVTYYLQGEGEQPLGLQEHEGWPKVSVVQKVHCNENRVQY